MCHTFYALVSFQLSRLHPPSKHPSPVQWKMVNIWRSSKMYWWNRRHPWRKSRTCGQPTTNTKQSVTVHLSPCALSPSTTTVPTGYTKPAAWWDCYCRGLYIMKVLFRKLYKPQSDWFGKKHAGDFLVDFRLRQCCQKFLVASEYRTCFGEYRRYIRRQCTNWASFKLMNNIMRNDIPVCKRGERETVCVPPLSH